MPKRPNQHQIASQAVAAVRKLWADAGAAVDELREDYGEDLLVQPSIDGKMDAARIWVQVKGTSATSTSKALTPSVRIKAGQLRRWLATLDRVIVILWNVTQEHGWYLIPAYEVSIQHLGQFDDDRPHKLAFNKEQNFDAESVAYLLWETRIAHADESIARFRTSGDQFINNNAAWDEHERSELNALALDHALRLMQNMGMIRIHPGQGLSFTQEFREIIKRAVNKHDKRAHRFNGDYSKFAGAVALESLLIQTKIAAPSLHGLPIGVLREMHAVTLSLLDALE
ncbi:hypothetical protein Psi02_64200 [Planotetraspora silvatica]|uniref:DUF4365 domain-containing protein n=1 Tax=Planotetraspora silvatica TaxID=234614 RepID=A0A8J3UUZ5_9ACTN|nr:DUF4365 domain-containing protein [Planotetraspora silvatica]GII49996.1 hypothetical protein Psi02_64200 [Planotetraspora silvatica]